MLVNDMND
jgi:Bifunctional DNA primase/polymerase, N-terminal